MDPIKAIEAMARATGGVVLITASAHKDGRVLWVANLTTDGNFVLGYGATLEEALTQFEDAVDRARSATKCEQGEEG